MTTEDKELTKVADELLNVAETLWDQETKLDDLIPCYPPMMGRHGKMSTLDFEIIENTRKLVSLAAQQLHVLRVDLEARKD